MDPRHLLVLLAVSDRGSITRAAESLNLSQPTLTKTLRNLEHSLNTKLLRRSSRGTTLTKFGEILANYARSIASELQRAEQELEALKKGVGGTIAVGASPISAFDIVPAAAARFIASRPDTRIVLHSQEQTALIASLTRGEIDIVVGPLLRQDAPRGIFEQLLYYSRIGLVTRYGHPLTKRKRLPLEQLLSERWIMPPPGTQLRRHVGELFSRSDIASPAAVVETGSILFTRSLLRHSDCIAAIPPELFYNEFRPGGFAELSLRRQTAWRPIGVLRRKGATLTPDAIFFIQCLQRVIRDSRLRTAIPR